MCLRITIYLLKIQASWIRDQILLQVGCKLHLAGLSSTSCKVLIFQQCGPVPQRRAPSGPWILLWQGDYIHLSSCFNSMPSIWEALSSHMENRALTSEATPSIVLWVPSVVTRFGPIGLILLIGFSLFFKENLFEVKHKGWWAKGRWTVSFREDQEYVPHILPLSFLLGLWVTDTQWEGLCLSMDRLPGTEGKDSTIKRSKETHFQLECGKNRRATEFWEHFQFF